MTSTLRCPPAPPMQSLPLAALAPLLTAETLCHPLAARLVGLLGAPSEWAADARAYTESKRGSELMAAALEDASAPVELGLAAAVLAMAVDPHGQALAGFCGRLRGSAGLPRGAAALESALEALGKLGLGASAGAQLGAFLHSGGVLVEAVALLLGRRAEGAPEGRLLAEALGPAGG